jgi:hypothetical protein
MTMLDPSEYKSTLKTPERQDMGKIANFLSNMASIEWFTLQRPANAADGGGEWCESSWGWIEALPHDRLWFEKLVEKRMSVKATDSNMYQITPAAQKLVGAFYYFFKGGR